MLNLVISQLTYEQHLLDAWEAGNCDMLKSSRACEHIKDIIDLKVQRRSGTWFFGEALVATAYEHEVGFYGSFKWLTNRRFVDGQPFPNGDTQKYQEAIREALWKHFGIEQLKAIQRATADLYGRHSALLRNMEPVPPDLWLIDGKRHRFIEVKLPGDWIKPHQLAGLALIGSLLRASKPVSVEIVEVSPKVEAMFSFLCNEIAVAG
jgi:hypothetical protein